MVKPHKSWSIAAATDSLTRSLAVYLAPIQVNVIAPGMVREKCFAGATGYQLIKHIVVPAQVRLSFLD